VIARLAPSEVRGDEGLVLHHHLRLVAAAAQRGLVPGQDESAVPPLHLLLVPPDVYQREGAPAAAAHGLVAARPGDGAAGLVVLVVLPDLWCVTVMWERSFVRLLRCVTDAKRWKLNTTVVVQLSPATTVHRYPTAPHPADSTCSSLAVLPRSRKSPPMRLPSLDDGTDFVAATSSSTSRRSGATWIITAAGANGAVVFERDLTADAERYP
jgi:hypothetical protein